MSDAPTLPPLPVRLISRLSTGGKCDRGCSGPPGCSTAIDRGPAWRPNPENTLQKAGPLTRHKRGTTFAFHRVDPCGRSQYKQGAHCGVRGREVPPGQDRQLCCLSSSGALCVQLLLLHLRWRSTRRHLDPAARTSRSGPPSSCPHTVCRRSRVCTLHRLWWSPCPARLSPPSEPAPTSSPPWPRPTAPVRSPPPLASCGRPGPTAPLPCCGGPAREPASRRWALASMGHAWSARGQRDAPSRPVRAPRTASHGLCRSGRCPSPPADLHDRGECPVQRSSRTPPGRTGGGLSDPDPETPPPSLGPGPGTVAPRRWRGDGARCPRWHRPRSVRSPQRCRA